MNDFSFVISVVNIVLAFLLGIVVSVGMVSSQYHDAIKECEKALPRDKHCKIIGVVDDGK
jgi:capsular polysaccharide biosynthesis protein